MKEHFNFCTDRSWRSQGAFNVTIDGLTDELLVKQLKLTLASLPHWTFNAVPKEGTIKAFYIAEDKETLLDIRLFKIGAQYSIDIVRLNGNGDVSFALKKELRSVFDAEYVPSSKDARTLPPILWELSSTPSLEEYLNVLHGIHSWSLNGDKLDCATLIATMSLNPSYALFDDPKSAEIIINILENLVEEDDLFQPQFRALMACSMLYKRPAYQNGIRESRELVTAIYEHAQLEFTWKTAQIKQTCTALLEQLIAHDRPRVLRQLQETYPALRDNFFPRTGRSRALVLFASASTAEEATEVSVAPRNDASI